MKIAILICSNRQIRLHPKTERIIIKQKIPTIFVKQNIDPAYKEYSFIHELNLDSKGASKARNAGIKLAKLLKFDAIAFTDDDCVITKDWITETKKYLKKSDIVFGKTFPFQPKKHSNKVCTCTFSKNTLTPITSVCKHWNNVGYSNNMSVKLKIFEQLGDFKEWLGPGSIGQNGEDGEFILRCIFNKIPIYYNPKMIIYHNKWLSTKEQIKQHQSYLCGTVGAYGLYAIKGSNICKDIVIEVFDEQLHLLFLINPFINPHNFFSNLYSTSKNIFQFINTFAISLYFSNS